MNETTRRAIQQIDRAFYREHAAEFAAKRTAAWPGWRRVLDRFRPRIDRRPAILDLGCGHGRFAAFLDDETIGEHEYVGVDSSAPLLALATASAAASPHRRYLEGELLDEETWRRIADALPARGADLVAAFGLLHHIPGAAARRALLAHSARHLRPGGVLAVSFWQFASEARFRDRFLPWETLRQEEAQGAARHRIDLDELDPDDHLLPWGEQRNGRGARLRYCRHTPPENADLLARECGFEALDRFFSDGRSGRTNYYLLLTREGLQG